MTTLAGFQAYAAELQETPTLRLLCEMLGLRTSDQIPVLIFTGQFDADLESWVLPYLNVNKFYVRAVVFMINEHKRSLATINRRLDRLFELVGETAKDGMGTKWTGV